MTRFTIWMTIPFCLGGLILPGCGKRHVGHTNGPQAQTAENVVKHDFGKVSIDTGPQRLFHEFRIRNGRGQPVELVTMKSSCGCLETQISKTALAPDEVAEVKVGFEVKNPGHTSQAVVLIWSDGTQCAFEVSAIGTLGYEMIAIPIATAPSDDTFLFRLYIVDSDGPGESVPPKVVQPVGVGLAFDGWTTLEDHGEEPRRPTRQVANASLDFSRYKGDFPVEVVLQSRSGSTAGLTVGETPAPSCH